MTVILDYLYGFTTDDSNNTITLEILGSIPKNGQPGSTFTFTVDSYIDGIFRTTTKFDVTEGPPSFTTTVSRYTFYRYDNLP